MANESQQVDGSRIRELEAVVAGALGAARSGGATHAEADCKPAAWPDGDACVSARSRPSNTTVTAAFRSRSTSARPRARPAPPTCGRLRCAKSRAKAVAIARHTTADECAGLADPDDAGERIRGSRPVSTPGAIEPEQAVVLARDCEAAGLGSDPRLNNSEGATVTTHSGVRVYGNSHGFLQGVTSTSHSISCALVAQAREDMQRDYWYSVARHPQALEDPAAIGRHAARRALRRLGARKLPTRRAPVLFAPELARGLIGHFVGGDSRAEPVPPHLIPAECRRHSDLSIVSADRRAPAPAAGSRQQRLRRGRRRHARSRAGAGRSAAGLRARQLLGAQARAQVHRQRRRHPQSAGHGRGLRSLGPGRQFRAAAAAHG